MRKMLFTYSHLNVTIMIIPKALENLNHRLAQYGTVALDTAKSLISHDATLEMPRW